MEGRVGSAANAIMRTQVTDHAKDLVGRYSSNEGALQHVAERLYVAENR
jgi:hypothetical protein